MYIKLILAAGKNDHIKANNDFMPLSLPALVTSAPEHCYELVDMLDKPRKKVHFTDYPDLVGISIRMSSKNMALEIADHYRSKGIPVIIGGPQTFGEPYLAKAHADAVAIGEGEPLWPKILKDLQQGALKDFYVSSPTRHDLSGYSVHYEDHLPELTSLEPPARRAYKKHYRFNMVYAVRGCPVNCDFCLVSPMFGKQIRKKQVDQVVEEIRQFTGYYYLIDDNVFGRPGVYDYYHELYDKISRLPKPRYWMGQANLGAVGSGSGRKVIEKAVESGFLYAAVGMESINRDTLEQSGSIRKMGVSKDKDLKEDMKNKIQYLQNKGVVISGWFTIGYDQDTIDTYYQTLDFCRQTKILPMIHPVYAIPGTKLYQQLKEKGKLQDLEKHLSNDKKKNIEEKQIAQALRYIYKKGYSLREILRRTFFYMNKFRKSGNPVSEVIHKSFFTFFIQLKLKKIVGSEYRKLNQKANN